VPEESWQTGNDPLEGEGLASAEAVLTNGAGGASIVVATPLMVVTTGVMVIGGPSGWMEIHGDGASVTEAEEDFESVFVVEPVADAEEATDTLDPVVTDATEDPVEATTRIQS
jgi:hypothetical protein